MRKEIKKEIKKKESIGFRLEVIKMGVGTGVEGGTWWVRGRDCKEVK